MENWRRKRTQLRREFTILSDKLEKSPKTEDSDPEEYFEVLSDVASRLFEVEEHIKELWCAAEDFKEAEFEADQDKVLLYKIRWQKIKSTYSKSSIPKADSAGSLHSAVSSTKTKNKGHYPKMPKLELPKFDGDVKQWLQFWGQFKKIHEDSDIDATDKFQYLLQSMTQNSTAKKLVESYPPCGENYQKALDALKARFARDDVLIETYVRGLITLMQTKGEVRCLSTLYDNLQTHLQALETLGVAKDKYASMLLPMIESALPDDTLRAWHRSQPSSRDLSKLMGFLNYEVESEERIRLARGNFEELTVEYEPKPPTACFVSESKTNKQGSSNKAGNIVSTQTCLWCGKENHSSSECYKAAKMGIKERIEYAKGKRACMICLKVNHPTKRCKSYPKCLFCKKRHFTIMCADMPADNKQAETSSNLSTYQKSTTTLLPTLVVKIVHGSKEVQTRVLIDSGAQRSYIKKDLVKKLSLQPTRKEVLTHCLFGGVETKKKECCLYDIHVMSINNNFCMNLSVLEQDFICNLLPRLNSKVVFDKLREFDITLTDSSDSDLEIGLLIGADFSGLLLTGELKQVSNSLTAIRTKFGWTIQGPVTGIDSSIAQLTTSLHLLTNKVDISDLWALETLGIRDPAEQTTKMTRDSEVLQHFEDNIKVNEEGRYEVCLPWKDTPRPDTNYNLAKKRLESTTNRLKQIGKSADYDNVFQEWLQLNIIEKAPDQSIHGHYMPHHAVIKESSLTTKIRPVFDASAKDRNGISLNSCLEKGVNLLEKIPNLLIDFRKHKIAVTADIAKAFLQVSINPEDRDYLRFLWWSNVNEEDRTLTTYRHRRVVFGVTSSPFHLVATINHHLDKCPEHLKETAMKLKRSFYVDNCVTSLESEERVDKFITEAKILMQAGMFDLRGWISNSDKVDKSVENTSILGVIWNVNRDSLQINSNFQTLSGKLSKRELLSVTQRVFDPIGFTCPTTIVPKMIIQSSWCRKLTWDEQLPADLEKEFRKWLSQAHLINECVISRRLTSFPIEEAHVSLHVFCDASKNAYSACIFLRAERDKQVDVSLVLAKSRVTPLKKITIPRLELIAATLATRLSMTTIEALALPTGSIYFWTDSSVVLTWIKCDGPWTVFVTNRVKEIKSLSATSNWRHVPGHMNPADLPSRGTLPKGLLDSRWWEGPAWLKLSEEDWPVTEIVLKGTAAEDERRKGTLVMSVEEESFVSRLTSYFSNYNKIIRMICWMLRLKRRSTVKEITYEEFEYAEFVLFKLLQLKNRDILINDRKIQTFTDEKGIIRLSTKLSLGTEDKSFKFPIVLPGGDIVVRKLVERRHVELQHAGLQTLMCNLRQSLWIVGQRRLVRSVISKCMVCKRFKAKRCQAPTGVLPVERMEASAAFQFTGVDLAGPLLLRSGSKAWIALFTCATYRAVHLEVVESLTTIEFLMALRRFVARRGRVEVLFSDNGTNFRGLDNAFASLDWNEIQRFSSISRIKWKFLPPAAPWWGGFYERMIGYLKAILRRVLGRASVSLTELQTILCDCEDTINRRPLTYTSNSVDECFQPLTPSMFIQPLTSSQGVADFDEIDVRSANLRLRYCQKLREDLRKRFRDEYISALIQHGHKGFMKSLKKGDIVLIEGEGKRTTWPLGMVEKVYTSADGVSRVVQVRTAGGTRIRPVQRLFPLELNSSTQGEIKRTPNETEQTTPNVTEQTTPNVTEQTDCATRTRSGRTVKLPRFFSDYVK